MTTLPILYRDAHLIAVNKPAGLLVHRSPLERYADETVLQILQEQTGLKGYRHTVLTARPAAYCCSRLTRRPHACLAS